MKVNISEIKLTPILESVYREKISDDEYFSSKYSDYISNSRLKLINEKQLGCPSKYKEGLSNEITCSLSNGSNIHMLVLQKDEFILGPDVYKPSAKLGLVIDKIWEFRNKGKTIDEAIKLACKSVHYYENSININRIKSIIKEGLRYYLEIKKYDNSVLLLSLKDRMMVENCVNNIHNNRQIQNLLYPTDIWGDPIISFNEDAFFINIHGEHGEKSCDLKLKMKADNWTIDVENKIITLNDLKTTGHKVEEFMDNSYINFCYSRQFGMYIWILLQYCKLQYGYNPEEWTFKCNVIVVETILNNRTAVYSINKKDLNEGRKEFCRLLKKVAYCEMYGYDDNIEFIYA